MSRHSRPKVHRPGGAAQTVDRRAARPPGRSAAGKEAAKMRVPVAVVGAGPAGLVIGHILLRAGIPFVLLERHPQSALARRPKAGMIEYRTVELLRSAGIADSILEFTVPNHRCEFRTPHESAVL